ncbi:MAG: hypothetical protein MRERV_20c036 [Mycoplasmataceae bacterium RV_VA103A]|nr:MAG: hypothetical protein MRERV_20c036 [Mycoplasmataceae bacterium RV_VA103A]
MTWKMEKNKKIGKKTKVDYWELLKTYKFLLVVPIFLLFVFYRPTEGSFLSNLLDKFKFLLGTCIWASLGILVGGLLLVLFKNKGQLIIDNTPEFLDYCSKSNGLVFFGPIGSGKTAILAMLANELPGENKYATFVKKLITD